MSASDQSSSKDFNKIEKAHEKQSITKDDVGTLDLTAHKAPRLRLLMQELQAEKAKLVESLKAHREFYEKHVNDPRYLAARKAIKDANGPLSKLESEISRLSIALGGKQLKIEPGKFETKQS